MGLLDMFTSFFGNNQAPQQLNNLQPNGQPLSNPNWYAAMQNLDGQQPFLSTLPGMAASLPGGDITQVPNQITPQGAQPVNPMQQQPMQGNNDTLRQQLLMQALSPNQQKPQQPQGAPNTPPPMGFPNRFGAMPQQQGMNPMQPQMMMLPQRNRFIGG